MPDLVRVVVSGASGRMGGILARMIAADSDFQLVGGLDRTEDAAAGFPEIHALEGAAECINGADVVIDFSAPAFLRRLLTTQTEALRGRALIVGTTGLGPDDQGLLERASETSPVLAAANFSIGVNLLLSLSAQAARVLGDGYDVEIIEAHHRHKEDAPSGTALALGEAVAAARGVDLAPARQDGRSGRPGPRPTGEIGFHAVRGGEIVGDHEVMFIGDLDRVELTHRAVDRSLFARGALRAARWLAGRPPGRYEMRDVLGLK